jgi:hypothetical protein
MSFVTGSTPFGIFDSDPDFQADADRLVDFTRKKLGEPVMCVHLSSSQVYASFEEACLEYSAIINSYQAKSTLTQFLGGPTGSLAGSEQTYPQRLIEFQKRMADPYGEEANVGGTHPLLSGSITLHSGQQKYNLQELLADQLTGSLANKRIYVKEIFHYSPLSAYRFFGTNSSLNYLNSQFGFESFTPETIFYLLPIWEDVLRGMQFEMSNRVRRSNYSYNLRNNELMLFPTPTQDMALYFTYRVTPDPTKPGTFDSAEFSGVSNLSNIPFGNIQYSRLNSMGKQWIRRFTFCLSKEVEGQIRSKFASVPIPDGDLQLNGPELITDARSDMEQLRSELKEILDETTYDKLAEREASLAASVEETIKRVPLGIYVG